MFLADGLQRNVEMGIALPRRGCRDATREGARSAAPRAPRNLLRAASSTSSRAASSQRVAIAARAGSGSRRAADGRAVRRARRDDARHPARRARGDLVAHAVTVLFVTQTCARRCGSGIACAAVEPARTRRRGVPDRDRATRKRRFAGGGQAAAAITDRLREGCADMPAERPRIIERESLGREIEGSMHSTAVPLVEAEPKCASSGPRPGRSSPRHASCSQLAARGVERLAPALRAARSGTRLRRAGRADHDRKVLARGRHHDASRRNRLCARDRDRHGARRRGVEQPASAARVRLFHHRPAEHAVDRLVSVRDAFKSRGGSVVS